jgi:iron complex outermembrane recepter protein
MGLAGCGQFDRSGTSYRKWCISAASIALVLAEYALARAAEAPATGPSTRATTMPTTRAAATRPMPVGVREMGLDELMDIEVTTATRRPERLAEVASAVQVVTGEEIRRSGAMNLAEALRLLPNLQVAQINAHDFAVTARGFNGATSGTSTLSNKLLVMIDGRSVYTPLFGGVFWDVQNVQLEDVDRIEAVSGPGGTLWGANAVNGVINVVTKSARDTQGLYLSESLGTWWHNKTSVRYGGKFSDDAYFRVYGMVFDHDNSKLADGTDVNDEWNLGQGGFRVDYYPTVENTFMLKGDVYRGWEGDDPRMTDVSGANLIGRFTHVFDDKSDMSLQMYVDGTWREFDSVEFADAQRTFDVDFQHRFPLSDRHSILWGLNYRMVRDHTDNVPALTFEPAVRELQLFSGFIQDEITLVPRQWKLTVGSKIEHNDYSGVEFSPSARVAWTPTEQQTIWAAVSRAVRSPTRLERDLTAPTIIESTDFDSEKVTAYELGYRVRPVERWSVSLATFFNHYDELRSVDAAGPTVFVLNNNQEADSWGAELASEFQIYDWWRLRGGYTWFEKNIWATAATVVPGSDDLEGNDPTHQFVLHSMMDLPRHFQFDVVARFVSDLSAPEVPSYFTMDVRLAWHHRNTEIAIVGQNLLDNSHPEFGPNEIQRGVYGRLTLRW